MLSLGRIGPRHYLPTPPHLGHVGRCLSTHRYRQDPGAHLNYGTFHQRRHRRIQRLGRHWRCQRKATLH